MCSYLENRSQYVCINDTNSEQLNVSCGVPQGYILGPALFILYVNDMCNVSTILKSILFADDTNIFHTGGDLKEVCETMSHELDKLNKWFRANKLALNVSKTNFMIFSNKKCDDNYSVSINGMEITRVYVTKFLGVFMDSQLNWSDHISVIKRKMAKNVSVMNRVRHLLSSSALYSLYCTLILPYLNYCCVVWGNTYKTSLRPLCILQKRAIRICGKAGYRSHTMPIFHQLKTLDIYDIIDYNSMIFMYKVSNNLLTETLFSYFKKVNESHEHNTRKNKNNFNIRFARTTKKASSISVKGPKIWNALKTEVKLCNTIAQFKKKYKGLLLEKYNVSSYE